MSVIPICSKSPRPRTYSGAALVSALWCRLSVTSTPCSRCVRSESVCSWAESDKPGDIIQPHSIIATLCMRIHTIPSIFSKDYCLSIFLEMRKPIYTSGRSSDSRSGKTERPSRKNVSGTNVPLKERPITAAGLFRTFTCFPFNQSDEPACGCKDKTNPAIRQTKAAIKRMSAVMDDGCTGRERKREKTNFFLLINLAYQKKTLPLST